MDDYAAANKELFGDGGSTLSDDNSIKSHKCDHCLAKQGCHLVHLIADGRVKDLHMTP